jgi:hypothetical protein
VNKDQSITGMQDDAASSEAIRLERLPRRDIRTSVTLLANRALGSKIVLADGSREYRCRVLDASENGLKILTDFPLELNMTFTLKMGLARPQRVIVRWAKGTQYGIELVR